MALTLDTIFLNKNPNPPFPHPKSTHSLNHHTCLSFFPTSKRRRFAAITKLNTSFDEPYEISQQQKQQQSDANNLDAFLSAIEFLSLASSAAASVYAAVRLGFMKKGLGFLSGRVLAWQCVVLVAGLAAGAVIRRRQWRRICGGVGAHYYYYYGGGGRGNLLERVERLEEDLRGTATIVQALARRLEKLGIRFRVTRKALKEPIAQTAALVEKNSEATRALAAQEDNLEKELGEIQKVLLAMQEQQQKQLELILAIGKAGKLWDTTKRVKSRDQKASEASNSHVDGVANLGLNQIETLALQKEPNNDRP